MLPVSFVWPGTMKPTWLMSGQSVCSGCGSDSMSCESLSLLMNVTRLPWTMVTIFGDTPLDVIVNVALVGAGVGVGEGDGVGAGAGVGVGAGAGEGAGAGAGAGAGLGDVPPPPPHPAIVSRHAAPAAIPIRTRYRVLI